MVSWEAALRRAVVSGTAASILSSLALAVCGRLEGGTAAGPNNGPSQWIWGRRGARVRRATLRNTVVGYAIHHLMSVGWATLHEKQFARPGKQQSMATTLGQGAATAAVACFVDYQVAPTRLQPGFDCQLSRKSLLVVYSAFGLGLALASLISSVSSPTGSASRYGAPGRSGRDRSRRS
jgi:hypothetical protein